MDLVLLSCPPQSRDLEKRGHLEWDLFFFLVGPFGHWAGSGTGQDLEFSAVCLPSRPAWVSLCSWVHTLHGALGWARPPLALHGC